MTSDRDEPPFDSRREHDCHDFIFPCPMDGGHSIKGMEPPSKSRQIVVRITPVMYEALAADAEANERTVSQTIRFHLRRAFTDAKR